MREILFRGKLLSDGRWAEGNLDIKKSGVCIITPDETPFGSYGQVAHETVGQYTGLTDKNGKRIFEGDIVRWASANTYLTSNYVYDRKAYGYGSVLIVTSLASGFTLRQIKDNAPDIPNANRKIDNYSFWNHQGQLEVIGNIHDNPELIGGKEDGT